MPTAKTEVGWVFACQGASKRTQAKISRDYWRFASRVDQLDVKWFLTQVLRLLTNQRPIKDNRPFWCPAGTSELLPRLSFAYVPTVDGRSPAPIKKPWNSPVNTNKQRFPMESSGAKWISFIHGMEFDHWMASAPCSYAPARGVVFGFPPRPIHTKHLLSMWVRQFGENSISLFLQRNEKESNHI